jgi:hypothetical protein
MLAGLLQGPVWAAVYYVSATRGSDSNAGTSPDAPFRTIRKAISLPLAPGDTVEIMAGDYFEDIDPTTSGEPGRPITFKRYGQDEVVLWGSDPLGATWQKDPAYDRLYYVTLPSKPLGIVEEYSAPKYIEIAHGGSWYQQRIGYVNAEAHGGCNSGGACDLSQLNSFCAGDKNTTGSYCWVNSSKRLYIRPNGFGDPPAPQVEEDPLRNGSSWRVVTRELEIRDKDYLVYDGLTFKDMQIILYSADNVTLRNTRHFNRFIYESPASNPPSSFLRIENVLAQDLYQGNSYIEGNFSGGDGLVLEGYQKRGIDNVTIEGLRLRNTRNFGGLGDAKNATIKNSQFGPGANHGLSFQAMRPDLGDVVFENVTFFPSLDSIYYQLTPPVYNRRVYVTNCTFMGRELSRGDPYAMGISPSSDGNGTGVYAWFLNNNLFWRSGSWGRGNSQSTVDGDYNIYIESGDPLNTKSGAVDDLVDAHALVIKNPTVEQLNSVFVGTEPTGRDPHLKPGSPAIDRGSPSGKGSGVTIPTVDWEGTPRPQGTTYDVGADEASASSPSVPPGSVPNVRRTDRK